MTIRAIVSIRTLDVALNDMGLGILYFRRRPQLKKHVLVLICRHDMI